MKKIFKISALSLGFAFTGTASAIDLCNVTYQSQSNWGSGAQLQIKVVNNGPGINNPTISWNYSGSESLVSFWNASSATQSGKTFTVVDSGNVTTGGSFDFNIIINNPGATPNEFLLNGVSCKTSIGTGSSISSSVQIASSIRSFSSSSKSPALSSAASSVASTDTAAWVLDGSNSMLNMVTVKKEHVAEIGVFSGLQGSIDSKGFAVLRIDLNTVDTQNSIRDGRIRDFLFETGSLPMLYYSVQLSLPEINSMPVGNSIISTLNGSLVLHGVTNETQAQVIITKTSTGKISVASYKPVLVNALAFDLKWGIEYIRNLVSPIPSSIGHTVPVYFNLKFNQNSDASNKATPLPATPATPENFNAMTNSAGLVSLTWADLSNNETGFLIRRKDGSGFWNKIQALSANQIMLEDLLSSTGTYEYKVIALNDSVPSLPSEIKTVILSEKPRDPVAEGKMLYNGLDTACAACHGDKGQGSAIAPKLNVRRDGAALEAFINTIVTTMPKGNPTACGQQCAEDIAAYFQAEVWTTEPELSCNNPINYGVQQLRQLTKIEYQNTINALFGTGYTADTLPGDSQVGYFVNNTQKASSNGDYDQYLITAEKIAKWSADRNFVNVVNCNNNFNIDCANKLVNEFGTKLFRRPLDAQEKSIYLNIANGSKTNGDIKAGIQLALEGMLSAPQFIYRHEIGEKNPTNGTLASDAYELTSYEMATWLAYTYTSSTPDAQLLSKAASNSLRDPSQIQMEINRLTSSQAFAQKLDYLVNAWLATESLNNVSSKDSAVYPGVDFSSLIPSMQKEVGLFFSNLMLDPAGKFETLYNANHTYVNGPLAKHYKIPGVSGDQFVKVNTSNRGGLLANGGFMARWADATEPSPIRRAVRVRERMLCQEVQDPPAGVFGDRDRLSEIHAAELALPTTTNVRKFELLTSLGTCVTCHEKIINPLGFGLEDFDSVGNPRTTDPRGNMINAAGQLFAPQAWDNAFASTVYTFNGAKDLGNILATDSTAQRCVPQNVFRLVMGVGVEDGRGHGDEILKDPQETTAYACDVQKLKHTMLDQSPRKMLEQLGLLDSIRYRKAWAR